jgi:hypothetical protein
MVEAALAIADIMQRVWAFRRGDGSTIAEPLRFGHGGRLIGHSHPNEAAWRLHDGCLEFLDRGGAVTTRFDKVVQNADGICVLAGAFNGRGYEGVVHVLHELSYRRQPGPGESQTGAPAA